MKVKQNGFTMIPLDLHFNNKGFIKILLGISKGRKKGDLREYKKQQDWKREKARIGEKMILIALGSNLKSETYGDPIKNCLKAMEFLKKDSNLKKSQIFMKLNQFLNQIRQCMLMVVVSVKTNLFAKKNFIGTNEY